MPPNIGPQRFACNGLQLSRPVDLIDPGKYALLKNVRSYIEGVITSRPGLTTLGTVVAGQSPVHTVRRLNDDAVGTYAYIIGTGTHLGVGTTAPFTDVDSGYSGDPLMMVPWRPSQSPDSWMYVVDRSRMRKCKANGTLHGIGLAMPAASPTLALGGNVYTLISDFEATTGWTQGGTAGAPSLLSYRVNTTITAIKYDTGTAGWASVQPAATTNIGAGIFLTFNPGGGTAETQVVQQVIPAITNTTIGRITYDSGTTGACSIHFATQPRGLVQYSMFTINSGGGTAENVIAQSISVGPDGIYSVRVTTVNTHAAAETITGLASFRVNLTNTHAAAETVRTDALRTAVTAGTGTLTKTAALDLSVIGGRPTQDDDVVHFSVRLSSLVNLTEMRIYLDVDDTTNTFTQNYYWYAIRASDFAAAIAGTITTITSTQTAIQNQQLTNYLYPGAPGYEQLTTRYPFLASMPPQQLQTILMSGFFGQTINLAGITPTTGPTQQTTQSGVSITPQSGTTGTGDSQWFEITIKVKNLNRVGSDTSRTLKNVAAIRATFTVTGSTNCDLDAWWVGGSYGPDIGDLGQPYVYRYRGRASTTGATSAWSPATRTGLSPHRQSIIVAMTQHPATECDKLDVARWGGTLLQWIVVGSVANTASPSFTDTQPDDSIASYEQADLNHFQPWVISDSPKSGTTQSVAGTTVVANAPDFSLSWAPGTLIKLNGLPFTVYRVLSTTKLETVENAGNLGAVPWEVPEPYLLSQNLPCLWGPFENFFFACGDDKNPGRLYFTKGNDPDATRQGYYIEVTPPTEPLINGCVYNGRAYVFSSERMFAIYPSFGEFSFLDPTLPGPNLFRALEVPNGRGLFVRWGLAVGPRIWPLSRDGIYETTGGEAQSITNDDLYPIFPHEGNIGVAVNGISPPNMVTAQATNLRLNYSYDGYLYFDYIAVDGTRATLIYQVPKKAWMLDNYSPNAYTHYGSEGKNVHATLVGTSGIALYTLTGVSDAGTAIACQVRTGSSDQGNPRQGKYYGEFIIDADTKSANISATFGVDLYGTTYGPFTVNTAARGKTLVDINSSNGVFGYNAALDITWSSSTVAPELYYWEPSVDVAPDLITKWLTQSTTHDLNGYQHLRDAYVMLISTTAVTLTISADGVASTYIIASTAGAQRKVYLPLHPQKGKVFNYSLTSTSPFRLFSRDSEVRVKAWGAPGPYVIAKPFGDTSRQGGPAT